MLITLKDPHLFLLAFTKSTLLDANVLFPNVLEIMGKDNYTYINDILSKGFVLLKK